ncbi:MAG: PKD domain-containing protein, partial [Saprospiraceae bacterium]|nr:PKD domain-containing protein [Saprospiraceae bacterium]
MNGGALRIFGNFQQKPGTAVCIEGTSVESGEEDANEGFTEGKFNSSSDTQSSSDWQNDGGYRYLKDCCINVTANYQLESTGSGMGTSGVDVIIGCCIEIGDRGKNNATATGFGMQDGDDSGDFQNSNRMYIYDTQIVLANGNFQSSNNTITACDMSVKVNKSGNFQINSGTLEGDGLCLAIEDQIENSGTWTANISEWYSDINDELKENNNITGTTPNESNSIPNCFTGCCLEDDCVIPDPVIVVICDNKGTTNPDDDEFSYTIQVDNPDPGCSSGSYSITGDDSQSNLDYDQVNGPFFGPFLVSNGSLSITITDANNPNCSKEVEVEPDCDEVICVCDAGGPYEIDCNAVNGEITLTATTDATNASYSWSTSDGNIVSGGSTATPVVNKAGTYTVMITNTDNGCTSSCDATVTEDLDKPSCDAGGPYEIDCNAVNGQITLTATTNATNASYSWSTSNGNI